MVSLSNTLPYEAHVDFRLNRKNISGSKKDLWKWSSTFLYDKPNISIQSLQATLSQIIVVIQKAAIHSSLCNVY